MWPAFKTFLFPRRLDCLHDIQSTEQFHASIQRERDRADRNKHLFSLVLFDTGNHQANKKWLQYFANTLINRIRSTDEAGWFNNQCIGVLLPYTSVLGAQRLTNDVCQTIETRTSRPKYIIYTYPSNSFPDSKVHLAESHSSPSPNESGHIISTGRSISDNQGGKMNIDYTAQNPVSDKKPNYESLAQILEPVLHPQKICQRAIDVIGSLLGLIILSPLFLLVILIIKTVSQGPIFFKQQRVGYLGKTFTMWKFRTMKHNADTSKHKHYVCGLINNANKGGSINPMIKLDDPQIIPFGRILRKTCIDELPQLINVLRGEMSLVGPRPAIAYEVQEYAQWHFRRLNVLPGMTGLWQVSGKNQLAFLDMIRLDIRYSKHKSLLLNLIILLKTPFAIISQINIAIQKKRLLIKEVTENA